MELVLHHTWSNHEKSLGEIIEWSVDDVGNCPLASPGDHVLTLRVRYVPDIETAANLLNRSIGQKFVRSFEICKGKTRSVFFGTVQTASRRRGIFTLAILIPRMSLDRVERIWGKIT